MAAKTPAAPPKAQPKPKAQPAPKPQPARPATPGTPEPQPQVQQRTGKPTNVHPMPLKLPAESTGGKSNSAIAWIVGIFVIGILVAINDSDDEPVKQQDQPSQSQPISNPEPMRSEPTRDYWDEEAKQSFPVQQQHRTETKQDVRLEEAKPEATYSEEVAEVQRALLARGYRVGPVDGIYGVTTRRAIEAFQSDVGLSQDGTISKDLKDALRAPVQPENSSKAGDFYSITELTMADVARWYGIPEIYYIRGDQETWRYGLGSVTFNTQTLKVVHADSYESGFISAGGGEIPASLVDLVRSDKNTPLLEHFSRNDHKSVLVAVHGLPDRIGRDKWLNVEKWFYGTNMIVIGAESGTILRWDIPGNMGARLIAGPNVTEKTHFSRGTHEDDVIRLQGTPKQIKTNFERGTETWTYPGGSVEIDIDDHRVLAFDDLGGLKAQ